ncbi:MAG: phosphatidylserine/phosphatidylglycerophosphate/cardiolipin synthase family protein [Thermomicrobiales bacterium]
MPVKVKLGDEAAYARHLARKAMVERSDLAIGFDESRARDPLLLVDGPEFYPRLLDDIRAAESSVHINQFGFRPGIVGSRFADVLADKARSGVNVRLLVDSRGSDPDGESRELLAGLAAAGVEVLVNRAFDLRVHPGLVGTDLGTRWNLRNFGAVDHRKLTVVDGRVGWIGTAGIEDRFEDGRYHDLFVRFEGPVVQQLQTVFLASYRWLGGCFHQSEVASLYPDDETCDADVPAVVLHNAPGRYRPITRAIVEQMRTARDSLDMINPYVSDPAMFGRIIDAARRGVRVRFIVSPGPNTWATGYAQLYHHREMIEAGVALLCYPAMAHAKAFVRDGEDVLVGTCNLEAWSLKRFFEINLRVRSRTLAEQFRTRLFEPDIGVSVPCPPASGIRERVLSTAYYLVSPLL